MEERTVSLSVSTLKFSGRVLKAAIAKYLAHRKEKKLEKNRAGPDTGYGRVSMKELQKQYGDLHSINVDDQNTRQFERVARKYRVKYKVFKTDKGKYQVFFKAPNDAAMQSAFQEYAVKKLRKAQRPSVLATLQKFKALVKAPALVKEKKKELER